MAAHAGARPAAQFTEKSFYLGDFRGRTLAIAVPGAEVARAGPLEPVLKELEPNPTPVILLSPEPGALPSLGAAQIIEAGSVALEGAVWRALQAGPSVGISVPEGPEFAAICHEIALRLGVFKLVCVERRGGLVRADGSRQSFVDLAELPDLVRRAEGDGERAALLRQIESGLRDGLPAVNLCSADGLADELFTYAGSGTLFTRQRYVHVRKLGIDDFSAAHDLIARGVAEGYLAARSAAEIDRVFASGFGAFVEGTHLAGIGALLHLPESESAEIASLYTLTRFLGEGIGGHLVHAMVDGARAARRRFVFACTTTERVAGFFEGCGFARVAPDEIPPEKWRGYDMRRRPRVRCLRLDF